LIVEDLASKEVASHALRSRYYAIGTQRLLALMRQASFAEARRLDDVFYRPVLVWTRPA